MKNAGERLLLMTEDERAAAFASELQNYQALSSEDKAKILAQAKGSRLWALPPMTVSAIRELRNNFQFFILPN
jgi:hypothetical protein